MNNLKKPTILIVDDVAANLHVLVELLGADYDLRIATAGDAALKIACLANRPDLILLDIMMPELDGYEVCKTLKGNEATKDIPVIFVTAKNETADETYGLSLGAVDYITKPFEPAVVRARINTHLTLKLQRDEILGQKEALQAAMEQIRVLKSILPICAQCKKIRDDEGYWRQVEEYISKHTDTQFSHSICPDCVKILYPEFSERLLSKYKQQT